jgi:hypothetical protein
VANGKSVAVPGDCRGLAQRVLNEFTYGRQPYGRDAALRRPVGAARRPYQQEVVTRERWKQIEAVFERALELPAQERSAFLQRTCNGDKELRREVQSLLDSHARAGSFIDRRGLFISGDGIDEQDVAVGSGQLIGSYRVVCELGRGGMGAVYLAKRADEQYKKRVAIKLIKRGMDTDAVLHRFRTERQILADFDHPNIARLFDAGTTASGQPYFVMEYIEGLPIDAYCDAHRLSITDRLKLFRTRALPSRTHIAALSCIGTSNARTFWSPLTVHRSCSISELLKLSSKPTERKRQRQ